MQDNNKEQYKPSDLYMGNPNLMKAGTKHQYTQEQIQEFIRCKDDPIYFIKKYVKIINVEKGLCEFLLYPYQEQYIKNLQTYRSNVSCWPRQSGKCHLKSTIMTVRDKETGEVLKMTSEELFNRIRKEKENGDV